MVAHTSDNITASLSILLALIPYTKQNFQLTFQPSKFFDELERSTGFSSATLQQSFTRLKKRGLITDNSVPKLTAKARRQVQPYIATKLPDDSQLMVIFDIPEDFGEQRRQLRNLLKQLGFTQAQRSVWMSSHDHRQILRESFAEFELGDWVEMYEVNRVR